MKVGDWVKYPDGKKGGWGYGRVVVINPTVIGIRVSVDVGFRGLVWFGEGELAPAVEKQDTAELQDAFARLTDKLTR